MSQRFVSQSILIQIVFLDCEAMYVRRFIPRFLYVYLIPYTKNITWKINAHSQFSGDKLSQATLMPWNLPVAWLRSNCDQHTISAKQKNYQVSSQHIGNIQSGSKLLYLLFLADIQQALQEWVGSLLAGNSFQANAQRSRSTISASALFKCCSFVVRKFCDATMKVIRSNQNVVLSKNGCLEWW